MEDILDSAKISANGQISLPKDIRETLCVRTGDTIIFIRQDKQVVMMNSAVYAMKTLQIAMEGEAKKAELHLDDEVTQLVMDMRAGEDNCRRAVNRHGRHR